MSELKCKNCVYWQQVYQIDNRFGYCNKIDNDISKSGYEFDQVPTDEVAVSDSDNYSASLYTGEDFGCIHFKARR